MPFVPTWEKDASCKSNILPDPQLRPFQVTEKPALNGCIPVPSGVTVQVVLPLPGPAPWMPVLPPPHCAKGADGSVNVPLKSKVSEVTVMPVLLSMAKNGEELVVARGPMDWVVNDVISNGLPFDAHQSPPCPFGVMQFVIAVRLITAVAEARLEKAPTINATRPKIHNQYVGLSNSAILPSTVCIRFLRMAGWKQCTCLATAGSSR